MAKRGGGGGKLTRIKSALKRWQSIGKLGRNNSSTRLLPGEDDDDDDNNDEVDLQRVYVGSSRRLYLVGPEVMEHPVFQELLHRSQQPEHEHDDDETVVVKVACEVVLFEHLLWMLENNPDSTSHHPRHLQDDDDDLVDFYTC